MDFMDLRVWIILRISLGSSLGTFILGCSIHSRGSIIKNSRVDISYVCNRDQLDCITNPYPT